MQLRRSQKRSLAAATVPTTPSVNDSASDGGDASSGDDYEPASAKKSRSRAKKSPAEQKKAKPATAKKAAASAKRTASVIPIVPIVSSSSISGSAGAIAASASQFPLLSALKERRQSASATVPNSSDDKIVYTYEQLVPGRLIKRYKRFLADIELVDAENGDDAAVVDETRVVTVYCPNTGPMVGLLDLPNARVQLSKSDDPKRKYQYTLEMIQVDNGERRVWVGVHSTLANRMVEKAIAAQWLPELGLFTSFQREVKFAKNSRVDFVLSSPGVEGAESGEGVVAHEKYVEVKSVSFAHPISSSAASLAIASDPASSDEASRFCALFPDTISERAQKHVTELTELIESQASKGDVQKCVSAAIVFLVQRDDCHEFAPSFLHDVKFAALCASAAKKGIQLLAYSVSLEPQEAAKRGHVRLLQALPLYEHIAEAKSEHEQPVAKAKAAKKPRAVKK